MAALDVAAAMQNLKTTLAGLAAWQTVCCVDNATEAADRIYEGGTEEGTETLLPCIFLDISSLPTNWLANKFTGQLGFEIRVEFPIPEENQSTYSAQFIYAWQVLSDMLAGINAAVNGSGQLMANSLTVSTKPGRIMEEHSSGRNEWAFILELSNKFI